MGEIEKLMAQKKYAIALEKSLGFLNTMNAKLNRNQKASLNYYAGIAYKNTGNRDQAISYLTRVEKQFAFSDHLKDTYVQLVDLHKGDYFRQEAYLVKLFEKYGRTPEAEKAGIELIKGYLRLKNHAKAIPVAETLVNLWKVVDKYPQLNILIALAYSGVNDYIEAGDYIRQAEKKNAKQIIQNPLYTFEAGKIFFYTQNFKKSIHYLSRLFNVFPNYVKSGEAAGILARAYEREKNLMMSGLYLIKALEKNPAIQTERYKLMLDLGRVLTLLPAAERSVIRKNYPLFSNPQKMLKMVKENSPVFEHKRDAAILLSTELGKKNQMELVIENYYKFLRKKRDPLVEKYFRSSIDKFIKEMKASKDYDRVLKFWVTIKPRKSYLSTENLLNLGGIFLEMKLYKNSEEIYYHMQRYTMYQSAWPTVHKQLARIYHETAKHNLYNAVRKKLKLDKEPEKGEFLHHTVIALRALGKDKKDELDEILEEVKLNPIPNRYYYKVLEMKADMAQDENKHRQAMRIYKGLVDYAQLTEEEKFKLILKIADLHFKDEEFESAMTQYLKAEEYKINREWIMFRKIVIMVKINQNREAKRMLKSLRIMNPDSYWTKQAEKYVR